MASPVDSARASLARGAGPAAVHPEVLPTSPGGYTWTNVTGVLNPAPSGRLADLTWDASDGYVLLYGWVSLSGLLRDTWTYSNGNWTNITASVSTPPPVTNYPAMAFDPSTQKVVYYSGLNRTTWTYHDKVWTNITSTSGTQPSPSESPSFVADTTDNEAVLFGGISLGLGPYAHYTWAFKNGNWTNLSGSAPFNFGRILIPVAANDATDHGVLVQGLAEWSNVTPYLYRPATFLFTGGTWTNLTPTLPLGPVMSEFPEFNWVPSISAAVYEASIEINSTGNLVGETGVTWEFSHGVWTNVTAVTGSQPIVGLYTESAVDEVDNTMILFGGERFVPPVVDPSTWIFSAPPQVTASVSRPVIDAGQSVTLTGTVANGAGPNSARWNLGDGTNSTTLSGSHSYTKTGLITATLTVTDVAGQTGWASASLWVNPAPTVVANMTPSSPLNGTSVAFQSAVTGGTAPFTYSWALGDGSTSTTSAFTHLYAKKGTYAVNLTVTDAAGVEAKVAFSVTVAAGPTPSTGTSSSSTSPTFTSGTGLYLVIGLLLLLAVVVLLGVLLMRRPKSPPGSLQPYPSNPSVSPPPGAGGPPH